MLSTRQPLFLAAAAFILLTLIGYSSIRPPADLPLSSTQAKIASAKARLQQDVEQQNRDLQHALSAARASLRQALAAPTATPSPPVATTPDDNAPPGPLPTVNTTSFAYGKNRGRTSRVVPAAACILTALSQTCAQAKSPSKCLSHLLGSDGMHPRLPLPLPPFRSKTPS